MFVRWSGQESDRERERRLPGLGETARVRTFDAPEAMGIRFHEVEARSAINSVPGGALPFAHTVNPYRGCTHACNYCFARPTHRYLELNAREDFEREIVVKVNVPERLRAEVRRPSWKGETIALGTNTDPYQWVEGRYRLTRSIWEVLLEARNPCSVLTKSPLLLRDLDLFGELVEVTDFTASLSIPTLDERAWRATEPGTPNPRKRIEAVAELSRAGIPCGVLVAPLMPGINDSPEQVEEILRLCGEAGAVSVTGLGLHLKGEVREIFLDWLRSYRPDLLDRYEGLYARGAFLPKAERERIGRTLGAARRRAGIEGERVRPRPRDLSAQSVGSAAEKETAPAGSQRSLF